MAKIFRNITLLVSILCLGISMCGVPAAANAKTVKLPLDPKPMPNPSQQPTIPLKQAASVDPETLKDLVEFQEIVTEGMPLLLKLFNKLMRNKFAKPLIEILLTCDKQNFMVSCVQGIFQKVMGILTGQPTQAQPNNSDGVNKKNNDYLQPHSKENLAQLGKSDKGDDAANKSAPRSDDNENDHGGENRMTGDSNVEIEAEYHDHQSQSIASDENMTQPANAQHPHTPLGPTSTDHKSEL